MCFPGGVIGHEHTGVGGGPAGRLYYGGVGLVNPEGGGQPLLQVDDRALGFLSRGKLGLSETEASEKATIALVPNQPHAGKDRYAMKTRKGGKGGGSWKGGKDSGPGKGSKDGGSQPQEGTQRQVHHRPRGLGYLLQVCGRRQRVGASQRKGPRAPEVPTAPHERAAHQEFVRCGVPCHSRTVAESV